MSDMSWQIGHHSRRVPSGDYWTKQQRADDNWRTRVVIPMEDGIVAVQVTDAGQTYWYLPGGGVEGAETLPDCAVREVQEETHLTVEPQRLLYIREHAQPDAIEFYIHARYLSGQLSKGINPEPSAIQLDAVDILSYERLEQDETLVFYPETIRKRLRRDLATPPTTALYLGEVP